MSVLNSTSAFAPTSRTMDPPHRPDPLADAVLGSLTRVKRGYRGRPWGVLKTCILAVVSLGWLPLLVWPRRFRNLVIVEQQQLWHLAEWLRLRTGRPEATELRELADENMRPGAMGPVVSALLAALGIVALIQLASARYFGWDRLWAVAWDLPIHRTYWRGPYLQFWREWTVLLCAGYFLHWLAVCRHAGAMAAYARRFNEVTASEGVAPVRVRGVGAGFHPLWAIAAMIGVWRGAIWVVPMAMAGVVHARYVVVSSRQTRSEFARRVRTMLGATRPSLNVRAAPCVNEKCRGAVPSGAVFCPRCGSRTGAG